jgi:uncharacterized protein
MKKAFLLFGLSIVFSAHGQQKDYPVQAVNFSKVKLEDAFWLPRLKTNHLVTIPASFERCESTGRVKNFEMAAAREGKFCTRFPFDDTDIYKTIEGASYSISLFPDKKLEAYMDSLIVKIGKAQEPDGYLYTARTIDPQHPHSWSGTERWAKEREQSHELYNAGHLYEAAAAHYYATGKKNLLNIALRNADLVCSVFGPGKRHVAPGHEVVEMGLVKLYRITGKPEYLKTAKFFIDERGHYNGYDPKSKDVWKNGSYWQDHEPATEQREAVGHAVRAAYLYSGMADIAALTGDEKYLQAIDSIWQNVVQKKLYLQGGIGAIPSGERFGDNYQLPNSTAYNETCAAIANVFWNYRMFLLHGDAKYIDVLERSLYNGVLSGVGLDGKSFFYSNAMQVKRSFSHPDLETKRSGWFDCSCCPTNMTRLLPSIPGYAYAQKADSVYINLFINSEVSLNVHKKPLSIMQQNNYPWDGDLKFVVTPKVQDVFTILLRIPSWSQNEVLPSDLYQFTNNESGKTEIRINGLPVTYSTDKGYAILHRTWKKGDVIEMKLPFDTKKIVANNLVKDDAGRIALQRGPLVYCAEGIDNGGSTSNIILPAETVFKSTFNSDLFGGIMQLHAQVPVLMINDKGENIHTEKRTITAIPYYAWANRGEGEMMIWFPQRVTDVDLLTGEANK